MLMFFMRAASGARWVSAADYAIIERYAKTEAIRSVISDEYYQPIDDAALMEAAIRGMTGALNDPYTFYYTPEEMQEHRRETEGDYLGLGILVQMNDAGQIEVIRVYENSPAFEAGIKCGDCITAVNGTPVSVEDAQQFNEAVSMLSGGGEEEQTLQLRRNDAYLEIPVRRRSVQLSNVNWQMLPENIGYIAIFQFSGDDVDSFKRALSELHDAGAEGIIIDLRNNPGGYLNHVVEIADILLPEGLILYTQDRAGNRCDYESGPEYCELPVVVLINGSSASASEILAAALQHHGYAIVIGERSYGKGIVQTLLEFEDGSAVQYTSAAYYTPSGASIHGAGVEPDIEIIDDSWRPNAGIPDLENDVQLRYAIDSISILLNDAA